MKKRLLAGLLSLCLMLSMVPATALALDDGTETEPVATDTTSNSGTSQDSSMENSSTETGTDGKNTTETETTTNNENIAETETTTDDENADGETEEVPEKSEEDGSDVNTIPTIDLSADETASKTAKGDLGTEDDFVAAVGDDQFVTTLASAFANAEEGSTITLLRDVELTSGIDVTNDVTLDLNGQTITISKDPSVRNAFIVNSGDVTFTIRDSGHTGAIRSNRTDNSNVISVSNGNLIVESGNISNQWYVIYVSGSGHATVRGGTLTSEVASVLSTNGSNSESPDYSDNAVMNVEGGKLVSTQDIAIYVPAGTLNVSGGEIVGATAIYAKSGITNITGGTIQGTGKKADFHHTSNGCYPTGDAIVIEACGYPNGEAAIQISGGSVSSDHNTALAYYQHDLNKAEKIEVSGGLLG